MSGALSGHLIDSYNTIPPHRPAFAPFGTDISSANLSVHGPMSFLPSMHGTFQNQPPFGSTYGGDHSSMTMNMSEATALKIAQLQARLDKKLGPEYISTRPGPGGGTKLVYAEGWKIINLANEIFGFNGWSSSVVSLTVDFIDAQESVGKFSVGVTAIVRVTLRDGVFHEDIGYGMLENSKSKAQALDKCKKEAVTDGVKRALRSFGNLLGNCIYDKEYAKEIVKIKVPTAKFDKDMLHRRPEFAIPTLGASTSSMPPPLQGRSESASSSSEVPQRMLPPASSTNAHRPQTVPGADAQTSAPSPSPPVPLNHQRQILPQQQQQQQQQERPIAAPSGLSRTDTVAAEPPHANSSHQGQAEAAAGIQRGSTRSSFADDSFEYTAEDFAMVDAAGLDEDGFGGAVILSDEEIAARGPPPNAPHVSVVEPSRATPPTGSETVQNRPAAPRFMTSTTSGTAAGRADRSKFIEAGLRQKAAEDAVRESLEPNSSPVDTTAQQTPEQQNQPQQQPFQPQEPAVMRAPVASGSGAGQQPQRGLPSMGGEFNFPPGVTPQNIHSGGTQTPVFNGVNMAGIKRNAEAMSGSVNGTRRPAQGMGLVHRPPAVNERPAPVHGSSTGDGGDFKRLKR